MSAVDDDHLSCPQSLRIKLYQAFIFSIPILFLLFDLKKRPPAAVFSVPNHHLRFFINCMTDAMGNLKDKLPVILYDEDLRFRDSMYSECLGEFVAEEELHQIPRCKHVFHADCIRYWLHSSPTCPLCRCFVVTGSRQSESQNQVQVPAV